MISRSFSFSPVFLARLWGRLRRVAVMAAPLVAVAALGSCCPQDLHDEVYLIRDPDPSRQALIDACRDPARRDCLPLCRELSGSSRYGVIQHCELHQDSSGYVQVHVGIDEELACE